MQNIYYQPEGYAFGDCMPFYKDGKFYLYHQRDTRNPGPFGEPFGWALAITEDFVHYEDKGEVLLRGKIQNKINSFLQEVYLKAKDNIMLFIPGIIETLQLKVRLHRY